MIVSFVLYFSKWAAICRSAPESVWMSAASAAGTDPPALSRSTIGKRRLPRSAVSHAGAVSSNILFYSIICANYHITSHIQFIHSILAT